MLLRLMEEDGTVVYFKTSPSACGLYEDEELVYREEEDTGIYGAASSSGDDIQPTAQPRQGCDFGGVKSDAMPQQNRGIILSYFSDVWVTVKRWLHPNDRCSLIVKYRNRLLDCISKSPLLTEDDFQLIRFIISNQTHHSTTKHSHCQNSHHHPSNGHTIFFLAAFLSGIILAMTALLPIPFISSLTTSAILIGGVPLIRWWRKLAVERTLDKSVGYLQAYLKEFEKLLSLVTQTTRLIREVEIISHGFSRPSPAVPISKLELKGSTDLQCPLLRKKLFSICQNGVCSLRRLTRRLCTEFTTKEEFDSHDGYLAFRQLTTLHQFMRDDIESVKDHLSHEEIGDVPSFESLESLKDASNLLAVQNSEMLKRLAIVTSFKAENYQEKNSVLMAAMEAISPLQLFICEASNGLKWSVDFHKNYLFGESPTHKRVVSVSKDASSADVHPLESTAHEVHCMDLKTQVALQRIRTLGSWLSEHLGQSEIEETVMSESVDFLRQQLSTIEQDLHGIVDHVAVCYKSLDDVDNKQDDDPATLDSTQMKGESTDFTEEEALQVTHGAEEEYSDDEMVFEAYISPSDVVEGQDDLHLDDEAVKSEKESKENSISMMKELNSVLAVRNIEKQRKRELRERKKQGGSLLPSDTVNHDQTPFEQTMPETATTANFGVQPGILETAAMENQSAREDGLDSKSAPVLPTECHLSPEEAKECFNHQSRKSELPFDLASREQQLDNNSALTSSAIAQAVAAVALRAGRANNEELFHDDQDSSSTTSEDETYQSS